MLTEVYYQTYLVLCIKHLRSVDLCGDADVDVGAAVVVAVVESSVLRLILLSQLRQWNKWIKQKNAL